MSSILWIGDLCLTSSVFLSKIVLCHQNPPRSCLHSENCRCSVHVWNKHSLSSLVFRAFHEPCLLIYQERGCKVSQSSSQKKRLQDELNYVLYCKYSSRRVSVFFCSWPCSHFPKMIEFRLDKVVWTALAWKAWEKMRAMFVRPCKRDTKSFGLKATQII